MKIFPKDSFPVPLSTEYWNRLNHSVLVFPAMDIKKTLE
jgi:hypothetical protein